MKRELILLLLVLINSISAVFADSIVRKRNYVGYENIRDYELLVSTDNAAAGALCSESAVSLDFRNDFLIKEMMYKNIFAQISFSDNCFLFNVSHYGYAKYGEYQVAAGYSRVFGHRLSVAMMFYYIGSHAHNYGVEHSVTFDFSIYYNINSKIGLGARAYNPAHLKYGITDEGAAHLPMIFNFNFHYKISRTLLTFVFAEKEIGGTLRAGAGAYYRPVALCGLLASVAFPSPAVAFSSVFYLRHIELVAGIIWKTKLGLSPTVTIRFFSKPALQCHGAGGHFRI